MAKPPAVPVRLLGKVNDYTLAARFGVTRNSVRYARRRRGIPPAPSERGPKGIDWSKADLGRRPDAVLAEELGVDKAAVRAARVKRGLPACPVAHRWYSMTRREKAAFLEAYDKEMTP